MAAIKEDYVSFEIAKLLKEKGFFKGVDLRMTQNLSFYDNIGLRHNLNKYYDSLIQDKIDFVIAPTLQMAMKWLRKVHNLHIDIDPSEGDWNPTVLELEDWSCVVKPGDEIPIQDSYEEACEAAIKYCLEHLI